MSHSNLTIKEITISIISGLIGGTLSEFLFRWTMGLLGKHSMKDIKLDTEPDERILFDTGANHLKGVEGVGGKLYLTNKRLVFKSHKFNIQNHLLSINLSDIYKIERHKTLGLVNNGLTLTTKQNKTEKFAVQQIDEWLNELKEKNILQRCFCQ